MPPSKRKLTRFVKYVLMAFVIVSVGIACVKSYSFWKYARSKRELKVELAKVENAIAELAIHQPLLQGYKAGSGSNKLCKQYYFSLTHAKNYLGATKAKRETDAVDPEQPYIFLNYSLSIPMPTKGLFPRKKSAEKGIGCSLALYSDSKKDSNRLSLPFGKGGNISYYIRSDEETLVNEIRKIFWESSERIRSSQKKAG